MKAQPTLLRIYFKMQSLTSGKKHRKPIISVRDLYKIYKVGDNRVHALDGVSFDIFRGEFVAIVGASGSGKSTLLNMLAGLEPPTKGEISIAGKRIDRLSESELVAFRRSNVGFIFQSYNLLNTMDAEGNVAMPLMFRGVSRAERIRKARKLLELVGVLDQAKHMPNQMSGGQQQRVAIARAIAARPPVILADEPTGNLDSHSTQDIMSVLKDLHKSGRTVILITHDNDIAAQVKRVIRIKDGRVEADYMNEGETEGYEKVLEKS